MLLARPLISLCAVLLAASCASFELEEAFTLIEPLDLEGPVSLEVSAELGSISVAVDPSLAGIEVRGLARLEGRDEERVRARFEQLGASIHRGGGGLVIEPTFEGGRRESERINLAVTVPSLADVQLKTGHGALAISGAVGRVEADSGGGSIELLHCHGGAQLSTGDGAIRVEGGVGEVRGTTGNGDVTVSGHGGGLELETSNGDVAVSVPEGSTGVVRLQSGNGRIVLSVDRSWSGVVEASAPNGQVRFISADGLREKGPAAILALGEGGTRSVLRTRNGPIEVAVRSRAPSPPLDPAAPGGPRR